MTICSVFFFFKQKTAYEMRISDWSSDVCSSDLAYRAVGRDRVVPLNVARAEVAHGSARRHRNTAAGLARALGHARDGQRVEVDGLREVSYAADRKNVV